MTIEAEIAALTTATTSLLTAVNVSKATLDERVADAAAETTKSTTQASAAAASAAAANASAGQSAGSAAQSLAIYGSTAAQQTAVAVAAAQASLAAGHAASASSVVQQDLSGVTATALHRSPNAVTAMFVYDTQKDSDGGAWTEKCQHTSWYNEAINGKWLGAQPSERNARYEGSTLGVDIANGGFDTDTAWTKGSGWTISNGAARIPSGASSSITQINPTTLSVGDVVKVTFTISAIATGRVYILIAGNLTNNNTEEFAVSGTYTRFVTVSGVTDQTVGLTVGNSPTGIVIDNVSIRKVTALTTQSGDYFQLTTDGRFYRLWRNLCSYSEFQNGLGFTASANAVASTMTGYAGAVAITQPISGNVDVFKVHPFIPGVAHYFECVVEMTDGLGPPAFTGDSGTSDFSVFFAGSIFLSGVTVTALGGNLYKLVIPSVAPSNVGPHSNGVRKSSTNTSRPFKVTAIHLQIGTGFYELKGAEGPVSETFRGNKRDFPRLSAIVAEAGNVTVYDLTEPGRPMWMRFVGASGNYLPSAITGVFAANSVIGVATGNAFQQVDFSKDRGQQNGSGSALSGIRYGGIERRNAALGYLSGSGLAIASNAVNAVAMTVLPDAPVDPVTGLKVPTIAVATAGGVSVIRHDGSVKNLNVAVNQNRDIAFNGKTLYVAGIPSTNLGIYATTDIGGATIHAANYFSTFGMPQFDMTGTNEGPQFEFSPLTKLLASRPGNGGIRFLREHVSTGAKSIAAKITHQFNAGYNPGDIRRAYLADNTVGNVSGPELVTNGTFDTNLDGWTNTSGLFSWDAGTAKAITTDAVADLNRTITGLTIGGSYELTCDVVSVSGSCNLRHVNVAATSNITSPGKYRLVAVSSNGQLVIGIRASTNTTVVVDNISVREVAADRSYKANGAPITGTLTKTQVASAAQLVAYSGFSAANYLQEPYSADLDFGTGEWSVSGWVNTPVTLPDSVFGISPVTLTMDTAAWTKGTGWSCPTANSFSCSGAQTSQTDLQWITGVVPASNATSRRWTLTITAISGTLVVYANNGSPFNITAPGTYYGYGDSQSNWSIAILRMNAAGQTCTGTLAVDDMAPPRVAERAHTSGPLIGMGVGKLGRLTAYAFDGTTTRTVTTTAAYNTATWLKARVNYTTDGTLAILVNGVQVAATRGNPLLTLNNANAVLTIGNSFSLDAPFPGSIALLKLSATVPTAEQATWMYEQEKHLFQAGAQCCLPDAGAIADLTYDEATDKWIAISATNESEWSGLVRTSVTAVPAGSYTRAVAGGGVQLLARSTTTPGVDVTIPAYGLREELVKRAEAAARLNAQTALYDFVGGFTANTTSGNTAILSITNLTYPTRIQGARVTGTGIPANASIADVSGTTGYLSATATATGTAVQINLLDFALPTGLTATAVSVNGVVQREGPTAAYTRLFDGFREVIRFAVAPGNTAWVQIQTVRSAA